MINQFIGYGATEEDALQSGAQWFTEWFNAQDIRYTSGGGPLFGVSGSLCYVPSTSGDTGMFIYTVTVFDPRRSIE